MGQISRVFCVDCERGAVNELSNKYEVNGNAMPYVVLAQTQDQFLVQSGAEEFTLVTSASDGARVETTSLRPVHALISKEDFFHDKDATETIKALEDMSSG